MRVLVISQMFPCNRFPTSGVFFANLMKELSPLVDELIIVTPRPYIPKILMKMNMRWGKWGLDPMVSKWEGIEIIRPYVLHLRGIAHCGLSGILMQYSLVNLVRHLIKERNIELILAYNMIPEGVAAQRLARMFKLPVAFWAIGSDVNTYANYSRLNYYLSRKCIEDSNLILTESMDLEKKIREFTKKAVPVRTFYKGIDLSNFQDIPHKSVLREKLGLNEEKRYILFVGRLSAEKGIFELCQAFAAISKRYHDIDLLLVGEEIEKFKIVAFFKEEGILHRVHFAGIVPYKEVSYYMRVSDIFALPTWAEGLPNVVMEAMFIGLPVVATHVDGIPEILENGVTGLSVPVKDVEKLTKEIIKMTEDTNLRESCVKNAKILINEKFNVKNNVVVLHDLLKSLIHGHSVEYSRSYFMFT